MRRKEAAMGLSATGRSRAILLITAFFGVLGLWGFHHTDSNALLGDVVHLIGDGLPFVGTLIIARGLQAEEQEDVVRSLIKFANRVFLILSGTYLFISGLYRYFHPHTIDHSVVAFAAAELIGNVAQAYFAHTLRHVHQDAHRSQMVHLLADIAGSSAVLIAAGVIALWGLYWVDGALSIVLGPLTIYAIRHIEGHEEHPARAHAHAH